MIIKTIKWLQQGSLEITYDKRKCCYCSRSRVYRGELFNASGRRWNGEWGCTYELSIYNSGTLPMQYDLLIYDDSAIPVNGVHVPHEYI